MIKYTFKLMKRNLLANIFITLQIAATLILVVVCTSSVMSKIDTYLPLRKLLTSQGECISTSGVTFTEPYSVFTLDELKQTDDNIKEIYGSYRYDLFLSKSFGQGIVYSCTDNMLNLYTPKMLEGEWNKSKKGVVCAVSTYTNKYKLGDTITLYDANGNELNIQITGILPKDEKLITNSLIEDGEINFNDLYEEQKQPKFIVNENDIKAFNVSKTVCGCIFATYKKGLSDNNISEIHQELYKYGTQYSFEEVNKNSLEYIKSDIILILPICICILILSVISSMATSAISAKKNLRTFSVFTLCGLNWSSNINICFITSIISNFAGLLIAGAMLFIVKDKSLFGNIIIAFDSYEITACMITIILNIFMFVFMPILIITNSKPKCYL